MYSSSSTVYNLFLSTAQWNPEKIAIIQNEHTWTFRKLLQLVDQLANLLEENGVSEGDRVAVISENRVEYIALQLACSRAGAQISCINWRLGPYELKHCIELVEPILVFCSERFNELLERADVTLNQEVLSVEDCLKLTLGLKPNRSAPACDPERGLLLLYTSGTTGLPKAAIISNRALIARMCNFHMDLRVQKGDAYVAWAPMFHMGGTEHSLSSLMMGSPVIICDGFDTESLVTIIGKYHLGWLMLVPATIEPLLDKLDQSGTVVKGIRVAGSMPDLLPGEVISRTTKRLNAPFLNSFGSTETGFPPASARMIPIGEEPNDLTKRKSSLCEIRILNHDGNEVCEDEIGEMVVRGPTLFSGYWDAENTNKTVFRDGWFHTGDLFSRSAMGELSFKGRSKYMIKSGGENIYPAEIEQLLLKDPRIVEVSVVKLADSKWGEIPVAFIARNDENLNADEVFTICKNNIASYKCPRQVYFIREKEFPRNSMGKIQKTVLEEKLETVSWLN